MTRLLLFSLTVVWCLAASSFGTDNSIPDATPETFVGGPENLRLITGAKSITVFRIIDPERKPKRKKLVTIDEQKCDANPSVVSGQEATRVIEALTDMTNFGGPFVCDFDPGVILRFAEPKHTVDLIVCFGCGEMILYSDGALVRRPYRWASTLNSFHKDARRAFAAIAVKAFPKDAEIQKLKE